MESKAGPVPSGGMAPCGIWIIFETAWVAVLTIRIGLPFLGAR